MKCLMNVFLAAALLLVSAGCERKRQVSSEEIPFIKNSIVAFENVIKAHNGILLDSILSSDAAAAGTTSEDLLKFVYTDSLREFVGFTDKEIIFRGDVARVDCDLTGADGYRKPVTITLRKEDKVWLIKKLEPRRGKMFPDEPDSVS
ncbi:MAG: hypothetical protein PHR28_00125 [candidate division Zixibacteria bacterium]|nr:hypothetical protein [candidate division Zixibacteria bacterium]